jgi:hypothetical protein
VDNTNRPSDNGNSGDSKRKQNAHSNAAKKQKVAPEKKPGYVSGLSKERRQELAKEGACFKCFKTGHIAKHCKANK